MRRRALRSEEEEEESVRCEARKFSAPSFKPSRLLGWTLIVSRLRNLGSSAIRSHLSPLDALLHV